MFVTHTCASDEVDSKKARQAQVKQLMKAVRYKLLFGLLCITEYRGVYFQELFLEIFGENEKYDMNVKSLHPFSYFSRKII